MAFHRFKDDTGKPYGSFEVWEDDGDVDRDPGWYWHCCQPGCLPDGDASGPFKTEAEALDDAHNG